MLFSNATSKSSSLIPATSTLITQFSSVSYRSVGGLQVVERTLQLTARISRRVSVTAEKDLRTIVGIKAYSLRGSNIPLWQFPYPENSSRKQRVTTLSA